MGASAILNAGNQVLHQFMVTGQQPAVEKKKLNVLESKLSGTEVDSKVILLTSKLDSFTPAFGLSRGANTGKNKTPSSKFLNFIFRNRNRSYARNCSSSLDYL